MSRCRAKVFVGHLTSPNVCVSVRAGTTVCDDSEVPGGETAALIEVDRERWRRVGSQTGLDYHGWWGDERGNV